MGHLSGKDVYSDLGQRIDGLAVRAPWNETLREILSELCSPEEAALLGGLPDGMSTLEEVARATGQAREGLRESLDRLCDRGLVIDLMAGGEYRYALSPMVVGVFEFTMMRTDSGYDPKRLAHLFHEYMEHSPFLRANFNDGTQTTLFRALPHDGTMGGADLPEQYAEVLDYERARSIVEQSDDFGVGICSCRHEHEHLGDKACDDPLEMCTTLGRPTVDYLVRRNLGRRISRAEMLERVDRSRERGLVLCADNVQRNVTFICHCCSCCCGILRAIRVHGMTRIAATSSYIARSDDPTCKGCNHCENACPIQAIRMVPETRPDRKRKVRPEIDEDVCLGCGVCVVKCQTGAMHLEARPRRIIPPETTFRRVLLMALDRGTLQNMIFDHPERGTHRFLRGLLGGFLGLQPVKRALMSEQLRSRFLGAMESGIRAQGKGWLLEL